MEKKVDLNSASHEELTSLPGVGPALANRIIQYRSTVGRFRTIEEATAIPGISKDLLDRISDRIKTGEAGEPEPELPPLVIQVTLSAPAGSGDFFGHRISATYSHRQVVPGVDGNFVSLWVNEQTSAAVTREGTATLTLPNPADLQGQVTFQVSAPDGTALLAQTLAVSKLTNTLKLSVRPQPAPVTQPTDDPAFGMPTRLRGRVIDRAGKVEIAGRQVVIWGATAPNPQAADYRALIVVDTDRSGYFSGPYPLGAYSAAYGDVSLGEDPTSVPIHLDDGGAFPGSVILVVDVEGSLPPDGAGASGSGAPRDPDMADLARADGVYSSDPGSGQCVDFTLPNRVLEEFSYSYVVRTTQPSIRGLTLEEPEKIDIRQIATIFQNATAIPMDSSADNPASPPDRPGLEQGNDLNRIPGTVIARVSGSLAGAQPQSGLSGSAAAASQAPVLTTDRIDARVLQTLARDPDGFSLTKVANAAHLTAHGDLLRLIAKFLKVKPDRSRLTCDAPVDWDDDPTIYQACDIAHGHILHFKQEWMSDGYSMGTLLYSLPLAPGQKKQLAILDWERREENARTEALTETEELAAMISRDRDISDVVNGTVSESVHGGSSSSTGSFAAGFGLAAIVPVGGALLGGLLGVGGGSSSADSQAWQDSSRNTSATALNQLRDRTLQSASSVRSQRSTVVQTVRQGERVTATTESVANYNHCHAITIQYFEVLRHLLVRQRLVDVQECLFIPLLMSRFNKDKALRWRNTLRPALRTLALRKGLDALERIDNNYDGSDLPVGRYADQTLDYLDGDLYVRFQLARPRDTDDDFDASTWLWMGHLLPFIDPQQFYTSYLKDKQFKDQIFIEQLGAQIAETFAQQMRIFAVRDDNSEVELPIDATLLSNFANNTPAYISLRLAAGLPPVRRAEIKFIKISGTSRLGPFLISLLPANSRVIVESGTIAYRTRYSSDYLFQNARIQNDIKTSDDVRIFTLLNRQELRNPRQEDRELARNLLDHLNENIEPFHHILWRLMSKERRYMLLDGFEAPNSSGRSVASVVDNTLIGIVGNCLVMPVSRGIHLDPTFNQDKEHPIDLLEHYQPNTPIDPMRIALPTNGVYAEAVMGACNSCEEKEEERFWRWEESPIPDSPTAITPLNTESRRAEPPDLTAKDFPSPIINMQTAPAAPDPTGLAAALSLLGTPNLFKDITGLEGTQANAIQALKSAFDTAQFFGGKAADLALQGKMARDVDKAMKTIKSAKDSGLITDKQAQDLAQGAIRGMIGGGTQNPASPMTKNDIADLANTAGANDASISVSRPGGETVTVDAKPETAPAENPPLKQLCGFFGPGNLVVQESEFREGVAIEAFTERMSWFDNNDHVLREDANSRFGDLVYYWLSRFSAIRPATLSALWEKVLAPTTNYGNLLVDGTSDAGLAAEAASVRAVLVDGVVDADTPANLNTLVESALISANASRRDLENTGPWSAVFVTACVRGMAIRLELEAVAGGQHVGRDQYLFATPSHREYVLKAHQNRFASPPVTGTYQAFRPSERTPQVGDIIVQDRRDPIGIADVVAFDNIPTMMASSIPLHGDIVTEVPETGGFVVTIGGNLGNSVRRRRYPVDATNHLVVQRTQLYVVEDDNGVLPGLPTTSSSSGLNSSSTGRIFAILSPVPACVAVS